MQAARIQSNIQTHGIRWTFDNEVAALKRKGCSAGRAFALAASFIFGRYVG